MKTFDGLQLHVRVHGPDPAPGQAPPVTVVLAHCWTADSEDWHYQVTDLLSRYGHDIRILTWDHRGHGRSGPAPEPSCTVANLARDMGDLIDLHAPRGPLVLAGHSIGGMTLMALAEQRPDIVARTAGAVFVSTSSGDLGTVTLGLPELGPRVKAKLPEVLALRAKALSRRTRRRTPSIERSVVNRFLFGEPLRPRDAGLVVDQLINCPPATMRGFYNDMQLHARIPALAAYDRVPTRVLVGDRDLLTPLPHARTLAANLRRSRLVVAPGAGHMLTLERHELVTEHLVDLVEVALAEQGRGAQSPETTESR
ncbi:alpha/beta fold hydrolase [Nocardioides houyundeii]|uniref:alpha/beta fold hydrolase n=1 Tax=Nocardioides houyundeii TaxID=2045452 RepID=UPI0013B393E5|nr:alpha/beta hydrolase [Nocardioides houyundeii]